MIQAIKETIKPGSIPLELQFMEQEKLLTLKTRQKVHVDQQFLAALELLSIQPHVIL